MSKYELIEELNQDGYLFTADVVNASISKSWLAQYVDSLYRGNATASL